MLELSKIHFSCNVTSRFCMENIKIKITDTNQKFFFTFIKIPH